MRSLDDPGVETTRDCRLPIIGLMSFAGVTDVSRIAGLEVYVLIRELAPGGVWTSCLSGLRCVWQLGVIRFGLVVCSEQEGHEHELC